ncbi:MAG TPA: hypothetical protein VHC98_01335 [Candidatus Saccharimonadales bacterium]|nr:hypothetical protein [Candidatus Saccharimonadales bacterium]
MPRWMWAIGLVVLLVALAVLAVLWVSRMFGGHGQTTLTGFDVAQYRASAIPSAELPELTSAPPATGVGRLNVHGQAYVSDGLILLPGEEPASPVAGELYVDATAGQLRYYDGTKFVNLVQGGGNTFITNNVFTTTGGGTTTPGGSFVHLQASTPGTADAGNFTISGTGTATNLTADTLAAGTALVKANSTAALQVQNASGVNLLTADTVNTAVVLGNDGTTSLMTLRGGAASGNNVTGSDIHIDASNGTGAGGSGNIVFRTAAAQQTPVTVDSTASGGSPFSPSLSASTTLVVGSNLNRLLMVQVSLGNTHSVASVTYNGTPLTLLHAASCPTAVFPSGCDAEVWYMLAPPTGSNTLAVTLTGADFFTFDAASFYNVDQSTPFGTAQTQIGTAATTSVTIASQPSQLITDFIVGDHFGGPTPGSGQTLTWNDPLGGLSSNQPGQPGTTTMTWTLITGNNQSDYVDYTVPINQIPNTTADPFTDRLTIAASGNVGIANDNPQYTLDVSGTARVRTDSAVAFQVQNAAGTPLLVADTTTMVLTVKSLVVSGTLTVDGHIITGNPTGTTTAVSGSAADCSSTATVSVTGDDTAGAVSITTGNSPCAAGTLATVTFAAPFSTAPIVVLTPEGTAGAALQYGATATTTTFTIASGTAPAPNTTYDYYYHVLQ